MRFQVLLWVATIWGMGLQLQAAEYLLNKTFLRSAPDESASKRCLLFAGAEVKSLLENGNGFYEVVYQDRAVRCRGFIRYGNTADKLTWMVKKGRTLPESQTTQVGDSSAYTAKKYLAVRESSNSPAAKVGYLRKRNLPVTILERDGQKVRISYKTDLVELRGWVPQSAIKGDGGGSVMTASKQSSAPKGSGSPTGAAHELSSKQVQVLYHDVVRPLFTKDNYSSAEQGLNAAVADWLEKEVGGASAKPALSESAFRSMVRFDQEMQAAQKEMKKGYSSLKKVCSYYKFIQCSLCGGTGKVTNSESCRACRNSPRDGMVLSKRKDKDVVRCVGRMKKGYKELKKVHEVSEKLACSVLAKWVAGESLDEELMAGLLDKLKEEGDEAFSLYNEAASEYGRVRSRRLDYYDYDHRYYRRYSWYSSLRKRYADVDRIRRVRLDTSWLRNMEREAQAASEKKANTQVNLVQLKALVMHIQARIMKYDEKIKGSTGADKLDWKAKKLFTEGELLRVEKQIQGLMDAGTGQ